jgi:vanillate O-demethylase monooxygenase subunit
MSSGRTTFPRNVWYVAAFSAELSARPLSRQIVGERMVLFRTAAGQPVALSDRCPHRHLPLSRGRIVGENIQCGYHGAQFGADGRCVLVPGQGEIPDGAAVTSFPLREGHGFVWVWTGDPSLAPQTGPSSICSFLDSGRWNTLDAYLHIACDFELLNDNLADVTHTEFVHPTTLGNESMRAARGDAIAERPGIPRFEAQVVADGMDFRLSLAGTRPAPSFESAFNRVHGDSDGTSLDFLLDYSFRAPSFWVFSPAVTRSGDSASTGVRTSGLILITPEHQSSCHYFHKICQDYAPDSEAETRFWLSETCRAFDEDKIVLEAQQQNIERERVEGHARVSFQGDWMGLQIRRLVRAMIQAEESGRPTRRSAGAH